MNKETLGFERISPSQLMDYDACPRSYYYKTWLGLKLPEQETRHFMFGTAIHDSIDLIYVMYDRNFGGAWMGASFERVEKHFGHKWTPSMVTEADWEIMKKRAEKKGEKVKSRKEIYEEMKEDGINMLRSYWDKKEFLLTEHGIDIDECEISRKIPMVHPETKKELPVLLSLRIDAKTILKDGKRHIAEFKTSSGKYDEVDTRNKIQGQCYAFCEFSETGKVPNVHYIVLLKNEYVRTRGKNKGLEPERIQHIKLEFNESDMVAFWHRVESILLKINNREFGRATSGHMPYCDCIKYEALLQVE